MNWKAKNDSTLPYFCREQDDSAVDLGAPYFQTNWSAPGHQRHPPNDGFEEKASRICGRNEVWVAPQLLFGCFKDIHPMIP